MKSSATFLAVLASVLVKLEAQHIGYSPEEQENWSQEYPDCGKNQQTPIEILTNTTSLLPTLRLSLSGYYENVPLILKNTGNSVEATIDTTKTESYFVTPRISRGPLSGTYEFQSLHYHWGEQDDRGSEHIINGLKYALELHLVHKNTKYPTLDEALEYSDGLAVLGVLFQHSDSDGIEVSPIADNLRSIQQYNATTEVNPSVPLRFLFEQINAGKFYTYQGSLTTPPCSQVVTWMVFEETLAVSSDQLNQFRSLLGVYGNPVLNNYRFVQPLNDRTVYRRLALLP